MPASYSMSWEPKSRRWWKQYGSKRYVVSCRQLAKWSGKPIRETKEDSYQIANDWWHAKQAEIDGQKPSNVYADVIDAFVRRGDYESRNGDLRKAEEWDTKARWLSENPTSAGLFIELDHLRHVEEVEIEERIWEDRFRREEVGPVPNDLRLTAQIEGYIALERGRVGRGLSPSEYATIQRCLHAFRDWYGGNLSIESINADKWEGYWSYLLKLEVSVEYKKKRLRLARSFIEWMSSKGILTPPPNLHNRRYRFGGGVKAVPTMTVEEVRRLVENASGQLRLHLLLMVNCGMTQTDISNLRQDEVIWSEGRIIRKRSKTRDNPNVPTVDYKLWPETWALLQQYRQTDGDRVLITESGRPWVRDTIKDDGKRSKVDAIKSNYVHLMRRLGFKKPMKLLRKTSASKLGDDPEFVNYIGHFLGHSPRSVSDQSYRRPSRDRFDEAVAWLGRQFGFVQ